MAPIARTNFTMLIRSIAALHALDPNLVEAVVIKESGGNPWAWNPEPHYRYFWNVSTQAPFRPVSMLEIANQYPPKDFPYLAGDRDQEWWAQQASWGLMQPMGALARELGYRESYLPSLCDPQANLKIGCKQLARLMVWAKGDTAKALSAYNAGKIKSTIGAAYAAKVLEYYEALKALP